MNFNLRERRLCRDCAIYRKCNLRGRCQGEKEKEKYYRGEETEETHVQAQDICSGKESDILKTTGRKQDTSCFIEC